LGPFRIRWIKRGRGARLTREIRFNVAGDPHGDVPTLQPDSPPGAPPIVCSFESPSRLLAIIPETNTGAGTLFYQQKSKNFRIILPPVGQQAQWEAGEPPCLPPEYHGNSDAVALHYGPPVLDRPTWDGTYLRHANGRRYVSRRISGFLDFKRYLDGEDIRPLLQQSHDLGATGRRMFPHIVNITDFNPDAYGQRYWDSIPAYFSLNAEYGQSVDVPVLTDSGYRGWSLGKCQDFWARWNDATAAISNKFISLTNEYDHGGNLVGVPHDYARPSDPLVSQGSAVSDAPPPRPGWGRREFHVQKDWPKIYLCEDMYYNRLGVDADKTVWGPVLPTDLSEGPKFSEDASLYTPWGAQCLAHESIAWGDGMTFHCVDGHDSRLLGPNQAACCAAAMAVLAAAEV
jgi:hypothetical protein